MKTTPIPLNPLRLLLSAALMILLVASIAVGWWQLNASAAEPPTLTDTALHEKALALAHKLGLKGKPIAERMSRTTLAESEKPFGGELGKDAGKFGLTPNMPVFVYTVRGTVEPTGPIEVPPNQPLPKYDRIFLVLNAHDGSLMTRGYIYASTALPAQFEIQ